MSLLMPKRVKYRKSQRGRRKGCAQRGSHMSYGEYGLQALENAWVTNVQIEAARVAISRNVKLGKVYIRAYPDKSITKKPAETRMGKGKGMVDAWVCVVKRGLRKPRGCCASAATTKSKRGNCHAHRAPLYQSRSGRL